MTRLRGHLCRTRSNARRAAIIAVALTLGCGGRQNVNDSSQPEETPERTLPQSDVWVLEAGGTPPNDTTYTLIAGQRRVVVLRNGAPDLATFAVLTFPDSSLKAPEGTQVELTVRVRPGVYGVDIDCKAETVGARLVFKHARHFEAPNAAEQKFGSATAFEHDLAIGRLNDDGTILLLPTRRPNQDNLSAPIRGNGSYVVAGPK
jgi:hypothetical protein